MKKETVVQMTLEEYNNYVKKIKDLEFKVMVLENPKTIIKKTEYHDSFYKKREVYESCINADHALQEVVRHNNKLNNDLSELQNKFLNSKDESNIRITQLSYAISDIKTELDNYKKSFFYKLYSKFNN